VSTPKLRGLGRGLGALLGEAPVAPAAPPPAAPPRDGLVQIAVTAISPNPHQPRRVFAPEALEELRSSIVEFGVLVPIIVRKLAGERFELIAGERRWRASAAAGLATIPAIVREADDRESLEVAIVENLQRENLDPLEEAMGFQHLIESYDFTQERVAQRVGRTRPAVTNALRLLGLSDAIKMLVHERQLSAGAARALLAIPETRRDAVARRAAAEGLSVRAIEALGREPAPRVKPVVATDPETVALIDRLRYRFATQVVLARRERGGTIEIRYANDDELLRIADLLLGDS
jgi:ParB family transcriptional regulator, chromosome partitioning protein